MISSEAEAVVEPVKTNSRCRFKFPAEEAGLKRGDWILGVNGSWGTIQDYDILRNGGSVSLQLGEVQGNGKGIVPTRIVTLNASRTVEDTPFLKDSVYTYGNKRIGYLMYNHFASGPDEYDYSEASNWAQLTSPPPL